MSLLCTTCLQLALLSMLVGGVQPGASPSVPGSPAPASLPAQPGAPEAAPGVRPVAPVVVATSAGPVVATAGDANARKQLDVLQQQLQVIMDTNRACRAGEGVFVVPSQPMGAQSADALVEDLTIMSRILQKSLADGYLWPEMSAADSLIINLTMPSQNAGPRVFFPLSRRPKPMYVSGYGALFFLQVDFPLVPPAEQQEQAGAEEGDPVWSEARRMLYEPPRTGLPANAAPRESYREDKVTLLRGRLIELLRHAANIRTLDPNDSITIVVRGPAAENGRPAQDAFTTLPNEAPCGRTVLTLRASKADIDLYAKGQLDPAQFEQRVQITNYKQ